MIPKVWDSGRTCNLERLGTCQLKGQATPCGPTETGVGVASGRSSSSGQQGALSAAGPRASRRAVPFHPSHEPWKKYTSLKKELRTNDLGNSVRDVCALIIQMIKRRKYS